MIKDPNRGNHLNKTRITQYEVIMSLNQVIKGKRKKEGIQNPSSKIFSQKAH